MRGRVVRYTLTELFSGNYTATRLVTSSNNGEHSNFDDRISCSITNSSIWPISIKRRQIDAYPQSGTATVKQHGVDGFRIDAVKHIDLGWEY